jgi:hypothetical protein
MWSHLHQVIDFLTNAVNHSLTLATVLAGSGPAAAGQIGGIPLRRPVAGIKIPTIPIG